MANYGYVTARCKLNPNKIQNILEGLNTRFFKNKLRIERDDTGMYWYLMYPSTDMSKPFAQRTCSLDTNDANGRQLAIRHGGGTPFAWWLDALVLNEIAVQLNGIITDDGHNDQEKGVKGKYDSFQRFIGIPYNQTQLKYCIKELPPEFLTKTQRLQRELNV